MSKKNSSILWCSAVAVSLLTACGYQFGVEGPGPTIGGTTPAQARALANAPTMAVTMFENRSFEPNIELKYTNYARQEFATGSGARVVSGSESADLVLKAQIITVMVPTLVFSIEQTLESRVTVMLNAVVEEARTKKVIWNHLATASSEYFVTRDLQFNRVLQDRALEQAGRLIAQDLAARFQNHLETRGTAAGSSGPVDIPVLPSGGRGGGFGR
jgi:hypothetical protein